MKQLTIMLMVISLFMLAVSCSSATEEEPTAVPATEAAEVEDVPPTVTKEEPTETPTREPTEEPTPTIESPTAVPDPTEEPTPEMVELIMDNCMTCHSDKEMLIQVANPEEEKEPGESSGVG